MKLDKFDLKILRVLQTDGRLPATRLGEAIGLTASPTWERVRRLEQAGTVQRYRADVAIEHLPEFTHVIVSVTLASHRGKDFQRFEEGVATIPQVVECWAVGGATDYVLRFVCTGAWQEALERALHAGLGIQRYSTWIAPRTAKVFAGMPLDQLMPNGPEMDFPESPDEPDEPELP